MHSLKLAIRNLRRSPALTVVAIASLAFGVGIDVTVFSVAREMIVDDLSARRPDQLSRIDGMDVSYSRYRDLRAVAIFDGLAYHRGLRDQIWHAPGRNEIVWRVVTSANFFDVLGVRASAGRLYTQAGEGRELAVASYGFWRKRLHADPKVLRQPIELNGRLLTLVGVLPPDYRSVYGHGVSPEIYISDPGNNNPHDAVYSLFGRQRDGMTRAQTRQALAAAMDALDGKDPHRAIQLRPMSGIGAHSAKEGDDRRFFAFFVMLFAVAGMLALIGCSNVAGLLVARALDRKRELAIRKALGASRLRLMRPLLAEGIVLVAAGALCGLALDAALRAKLSALHWPSAYGIPFEFHFQSDSGLLLYASLAAFAALMLSSLLPALRSIDADIALAMKQGAPAFSVRRWDLRRAFVTVQVVLSIVLLSLGGLFTRSLLHLIAAGPGFDAGHTLIAAVHTLPGNYSEEQLWTLREQVTARVLAVPGVTAVTSTGTLPLMGELPEAEVRRAGEPLSSIRRVYIIGAGESYCKTLGIPILRGRDIQITDRNRDPVPVIVNRTFAEQFFPDADPISQVVVLGREDERRFQVAGVAADFKMRTLGEPARPAIFAPDFNGQLLVRVSGNPSQWIEPLRRALRIADATAALDVRPLSDAAAGALFPMRVASAFVGTLSILGLALALVGLYSSISYAAGRRTREFGIRAALGASRNRIVWTALRGGLVVLATGALGGIPLALWAIHAMADLLPAGLSPWDPAPLCAVLLLLLASGAAATWLPARRAGSINPSAALRQE